jgi:hypothetical protein
MMGLGSNPSRQRSLSGLSRVVLGAALMVPTALAAKEPWPAKVSAHYILKFNGVGVGTLDFNSTTGPSGYTLTTAAQMSVLFGAVKWVGNSTVSGTVVAQQPKPRTYAFTWLKNKKGGEIKLGFQDGKASSVSIEPPHNPSPETVPITDGHKAGVLDPLSAVMAMTRETGSAPCVGRAAVFDGKHRFNIVMSYKRQTRIAPRKPGGVAMIGTVCRLTYEPIAGHKDNADTKAYAANTDVEALFVPMDPGGTSMLQVLTIPTKWGTGTMVADRIEVTNAAGVRIGRTD